ncbi:MAG: OmpH family outer membrane protein [Muribaculaceae bacterium]|nr:OmpH family outer membrane protein [Muribaculaceae bacterium]
MSAQTRVATVDMKAVFDAMPEKVEAESQLKVLSDRYEFEFNTLRQDFKRKYSDYQSVANDPTVPQTIKERRIQEIQENDRKIAEFEREARKDIDDQKDTLLAPIKAKLNDAIKAVADAEGVTYVLDSSVGVLYQGAGAIDLTVKVKRLLGIE